MDKIGATSKESKRINNISVSIFLFLLEIYILIVINFVDIFNYSMINNFFVQIVFQAITHLIVFTLSFTIVYNVTKGIYSKIWIRKNKKIWIKGIWLHIHVKDEIRIGTVKFKQNFHTIEADGHNIYPYGLGYDTWRETKWYYLFGKISDGNIRFTDLLGFYRAGHAGNQNEKDGIHSLELNDPKTGKLTASMQGIFKDTVKEGDVVIDDKRGDLFFFRADDEVLNFLRKGDSGSIDYERLSKLHLQEQFQNEPYVKQLKKSINKLGSIKESKE